MQEIFGKHEGNVKYYRLVDCNSEDEFDAKLEALKEKWEERGKTSASTGGSQFTIGFENRRYKIQFFSPTKFPNPVRTYVKYVSFIWNMQSTTHGIKLISQAFLLIFVPRAQGRNFYPYS